MLGPVSTDGSARQAIETEFAALTPPPTVAVSRNRSDLWIVSAALLFLLGSTSLHADTFFRQLHSYDSGGFDTASVAIGDLNGDGKADIALANRCGSATCGGSGGSVSVLLGNGDGTFQTALTYAFPAVSIAIGDVNGDGKPDLAATGENGVAIFLGNGDGTFQAVHVYDSGGTGATGLALADVNKDGKLDLVVGSVCLAVVCGGRGVVSVLLGNGDGTFQDPRTYDSGGVGVGSYPGQGPRVAVQDLNGDGKADIAVSNPDGNIGVLLGKGDGTFRATRVFNAGGGASAIVVADVNKDGKPDLVVANWCCGGGVGVLLGNGNGTFQTVHNYDSGGWNANSIVVEDANRDGQPDILVTNTQANGALRGAVGLLLGNGDGTFQATQLYNSGGQLTTSIAIADINGDSKTDMVVANGWSSYNRQTTGSVTILIGTAKYTTATKLSSGLNPSVYGQSIAFTAAVTVAGSTIPTGKVKLISGERTIGTATLDDKGEATFSQSKLNAADDPLAAVYVGDLNHSGSTSLVLDQIVQEATASARITSSQNPSAPGQAVTFTAKISSPTVTPTGQVTFTAGSTVLGTVQLAGGSAKITTSAMSVGTTQVVITYGGNSNITSSTAAVAQTVQP
jgi:hypothetical protein